LIGVVAGLLPTPARAAPPGQRFDGQWTAFLTCPASRDAAAYNFEFGIVIRDGVLHGEHGRPGEPSWLTLDGTLQPDGTAQLTARGLTGMAAYSVGNVPNQTPYFYHVDAKFGPTSGHGIRLELRPCTYVFSKP
jgi:hypothetical protein